MGKKDRCLRNGRDKGRGLPANQTDSLKMRTKKARRVYALLASAFLLSYTLHIFLNLRTQNE